MTSASPPLDFIADVFALAGELVAIEPIGRGNIHDSFRVTCSAPVSAAYLLQRLNQQVFPDIDGLMDNISRLTVHLRQELALRQEFAPDRRCMELVPTRDGADYAVSEVGEVFRVFRFIDDSVSYQSVENPEQANLAARAYGDFQSHLSTLAAETFTPSIPDFHNTRKRFSDFAVGVTEDLAGRVYQSKAEIEFAWARESLAGRLLSLVETGVVPERLAHNDAKLDNVLFDRFTGEVLCVCDLDTVMPGLSLYDFGDLVRSCASRGNEDQEAEIDATLFEALVEGYLDTTRGFLTEVEVEHLVIAGQLISFETGMRFLTDYLSGDIYFRTDYPEHNLKRCRSQFRLVSSLERYSKELNRIVEKFV